MATAWPARPRPPVRPPAPTSPATAVGQGRARTLLLSVVAIWGGTFPVLKLLVGVVSPTMVVAVRFTLGALALVSGYVLWEWRRWIIRDSTRRRPRPGVAMAQVPCGRPGWRRGFWFKAILLGTFLGLAYLAQTAGLLYTSAAKAGFLTGLFVVFTPLMEWLLFARRPSSSTWGAVGLAVVGLSLLSVEGSSWRTMGQIERGDWLVISSAFLYGVQLALAGQWAREEDPLQLSLVEIPTVAILAWLSIGIFAHHPVLGFGHVPSPAAAVLALSWDSWAGLLYLALLATAVALVAQLYGQRFLPAAQAAVIFALEPVFGALFSFIFLGERLSLVNLVGAGILVASSVWVSWPATAVQFSTGSGMSAPQRDDKRIAGISSTEAVSGTADSADSRARERLGGHSAS